jgi:enterochelin esterase-like enzyme
MSPSLRRTHVLMLPGGHSWKVWKVAAPRLLQDISHDETTPPAHGRNEPE